MGQKVHPTSFRLGSFKPWHSTWFSQSKMPEFLMEDYQLRQLLRKNYRRTFIDAIEIARFPQQVSVTIAVAKPGVIIGRKGAEIENLTKRLQELVGGKKVNLSVKEVKQPELSAGASAEDIAQQIERRVAYKRAIRQAIRAGIKSGAKGVKIRISGRLNGVEIARTEEFKEGRIPLGTLSADIDYALAEAHTDMGVIGVKVWICR